jgi:hypothetical protein
MDTMDKLLNNVNGQYQHGLYLSMLLSIMMSVKNLNQILKGRHQNVVNTTPLDAATRRKPPDHLKENTRRPTTKA